MKILLAVDGSEHALDAVKWVADHIDLGRDAPVIELVYVHLAVPKLPFLNKVVTHDEILGFYEEEGNLALVGAKHLLNTAGIKFNSHVLVGTAAEAIVEHAAKWSCELIVLAPRGMGATGNLLLGSVATKVLHLSNIPVLMVK